MLICGCAGFKQYSWKYIMHSLIMCLVIGGMIILLFHAAMSQPNEDDFRYFMAEPVKQANSRVQTVNFPFQKNVFSPSTAVKCPKGYFRCNSSLTCIELDKRCDSFVDCSDAEDERNCACAFRMPMNKFCDKYPDCFDHSDENFCSYCPTEYYNCENGKCIPYSKVCDSRPDCDNSMDENFCYRLSSGTEFSSRQGMLAPSSGAVSKTGYLLMNRNGLWYPMCASQHDAMQDALVSHACVSITSNPLATNSYEYKRFDTDASYEKDYIYYVGGTFIKWNRCLGDQGIAVTCDDVHCGFNPRLMLPRPNQGRIVGGDLSEAGAWPWHAAIYKNGSYSCGATLINNYWLLTAAHCFPNYRNNYYEVQLGMLRRRSFTPHQKTHRIVQVITHPHFNMITLEYDIALIKTFEPVTFDFWVRPICLPDPNMPEYVGSVCTAVGWGDTGETEDDSDDLQEVHIPLTSSCRNSDRWLCAGLPEGGRDACQGDSGGPLMCLRPDGLSWYIAGIISSGTGCARPHSPGMYTRVAYYIPWINNVMETSTISKEDVPLPNCPGWTCSAVGGGNCLEESKVCDGHVDCYDAHDEMKCKSRSKVQQQQQQQQQQPFKINRF